MLNLVTVRAVSKKFIWWRKMMTPSPGTLARDGGMPRLVSSGSSQTQLCSWCYSEMKFLPNIGIKMNVLILCPIYIETIIKIRSSRLIVKPASASKKAKHSNIGKKIHWGHIQVYRNRWFPWPCSLMPLSL